MSNGNELFRGVGEDGAALLRDILGLSSGTMATIARDIGWPAWLRTNATAVDRLQLALAEFAADRFRGGRGFKTWGAAWGAYVNHYHRNAAEAKRRAARRAAHPGAQIYVEAMAKAAYAELVAAAAQLF